MNHDTATPNGIAQPGQLAHTHQAEPKIEIFDYEEPETGIPDATPTAAPVKLRWRPGTVGDLKRRLADARAYTAVKRHDKQLRHAQEVTHRAAMANATEWSTAIERARRERTRDAAEHANLAQLHRWAARSGERARIRAEIQRSAEMRALRVAKVRRHTMAIGLPVMAGFAAISTPGVQKGMVNLLSLETGSVGWWTAWAVEPLLIAVATSIIVVKSVLKMSGGFTDWRADVAKWGALLFSVALNMTGGWNSGGGLVTAFGEALGHSVGAVGAAVSAWLIGVFVDYASKARPWDGAPRLADLGLLPTVTGDAVTGAAVTPAVTGDRYPAVAVTVAGVSVGDATLAVTRTASPAAADRSTVTGDADAAVVEPVTPAPSPGAVTPTPVTSDAPAVTPAPAVTRHPVPSPRRHVTQTPPATDTPVTASSNTSGDGKVRPLSRDLIDAEFAAWTPDQIKEYAAKRAQQVVAGGGSKTAGMREYFLTCLALGVEPEGTAMARAAGAVGSLGRTKAKEWHGELTVADAEQVLHDALARVTAELTAGGDAR